MDPFVICVSCLSLLYCLVCSLQPCDHLLGKAYLLALLCMMFSCVFVTFPYCVTGCVAQSVTCLTADPGVAGLIPAWSHTFMEIDHEIISTVILLPSIDLRMVIVSFKRKYVQEVLVNCLVKLAQEKKCG